ncbi:MAG TPA: alkaline phosphatase family protein [Anaerolineales bacterium]|nr:alkaline phosphatase family protein [Anaerolineales bacterium]
MRTIMVGFDSFDPGVFENLHNSGRMPNLSRFVEQGGYSPLIEVSPPQTEVSWTSIATGVDPGSHGIFDFVHRDPQTYVPYVSLLPTKQTVVGEQFLPPYTTKTLFHEAAEMGFPATALWWPALFPARPDVPVSTIPGLGTPDIRGQIGVGTYLTTEPGELKKTRVLRLESPTRGRYTSALEGPQVKAREGLRPAMLPLTLDVVDASSARLTLGDQRVDLRLGQWSPVFEIKFKAGFAFTVHAITQVILTELKDRVSLYFVPLQIHPLHSLWHYATPPNMVKDAWKVSGGYLTLGWPQDTNALEDGCINDEQFIGLCESIFVSRQKIFFQQLGRFREGVLAGIFDCLDRVQHMFTRSDPEVVNDWYVRLDGFVGEVQQRIASLGLPDHRLLILSDHGFKTFEHKVHLNHWLVGNGYMSMARQTEVPDLKDVNWAGTRAYAVGLNSLYLNVANREGQGTVTPEQIEPLLEELKTKLLAWKTDDGRQILSQVLLKHEAFTGPYTRFGPDLVMGYAPGFRASSETGLGKSASVSLEDNHDHWGADHCIDATKVPGVLFANRDLRNMPGLSFRDIPFLALGKHLDQSYIKPPSQVGPQGQKDLEERLKGLGYL